MAEIIRIRDAVYTYPESGAPAVNRVTLSVNEGEFLSVVGHNGSGKSTLAKLMNALFVPASGTVVVNGFDTRDEEHRIDVRRCCGMVFQNPDNQLVATIVEEDVAFGLENLGVPTEEIRGRVDEALRLVGMGEFAQAAPHMLSGGQKQRIAIAGVVAMRPRVIVFDEATAMLDPAGRDDVMRLIHRLNREEGITVVLITHFMEEAAQADRVAVMDQGRILKTGSPGEIFTQVEMLRNLGLDVPEMTDLANRLRAGGMDLKPDILTIPEMVEALCRLKSKT
ncbi:MAG: energy-coupling factor transporter ATPase [Clostridia bacterium]|nr:energy-coupling factor transporter ATPase [Clostridia bacterium]